MGDAKPADIDWANPGPARPGMGIYGRQQQRAKGGILGMLKGSLLSERQQEIYYYVLFVVTFSVSWFIDRPGQHSYLLADRVRSRFLEPTFRPDLASVSPRACLRARGPRAGNAPSMPLLTCGVCAAVSALPGHLRGQADRDFERRVAWEDVHSIEELWGWMEGPLLAVAYDEDTPGSGVGNVLGYAGLCNGIRVRQVRVKPHKCERMPEWAQNAITQQGGFQGDCYARAEIWNEEKERFGPNSTSKIFPWTESSSWGLSTSTMFGSYSASGYIFDLPSFNKTRARELMSFHRQNRFLDLQTRAVFIDATLFHPQMERFVSMRLQAEIPESGGVETSSLFISTRINTYVGVLGMIQLIIEAIFVIQLSGFCFVEIMQLRKMGVEYVKRFWGMVMLTKGVLLLCLVGFRVITFQTLEKQRREWDEGKDSAEFIDMHHVPTIILLDDNVLAVMSLLIYARLFKYGAETKGIAHLYKVIYKSMAEIIPFLGMHPRASRSALSSQHSAHTLHTPSTFRPLCSLPILLGAAHSETSPPVAFTHFLLRVNCVIQYCTCLLAICHLTYILLRPQCFSV
jgi:hypothetical protein